LRKLRLVVRALAIALATAVVFVVYVVGRALATPFGRGLRWRDRSVWLWCRALTAILGVRIERLGRIPPDGCLIVSNHLSYVDVFVLGAQRPTSFVAKAEVARWPVIGLLCRAAGIVFVQREDKRRLPEAAERLRSELARGSTVVLFPEGTSTGGDVVLPFRASLLAPAAEAGLPVAHATLAYRTAEGDPPARDAVCWWRDMTFGSHVLGLLQLRRIDARVAFGDEELVDDDRKRLASRLHEAVLARFVPDVPAAPTEVLPARAGDPAIDPALVGGRSSPCAR
jgi:1-acyl-sn-glycerol-3-phosphate acyltransferase